MNSTTESTQTCRGSILIVDDNPVNLKLLSSMLVKHNFHVKAAINGRRALAQTQFMKPELIMLDISMPDIDGYEVCRQLKANETTRDIPIIFISALDEVIDKVKAFQVGGVDYVTKPFQFEEVLVRIETQLQMSRLQKELISKNEALLRKNEELLQANRRANLIFSALSEMLPGSILDGKYRLEKKIGEGGFGAVYQATHLGLNRSVAIKIFQPSRHTDMLKEQNRFRLEGISACRVNHPNAISILDSGLTSEGVTYLVMELLEGTTLAQELRQKKKLSTMRCAEVLLPVCEVLDVAHKAGIIHRDIKPENIFLHQTPNGEIIKLVDFGIAKLFGDTNDEFDSLTMPGTVIGTPAYMSPERLSNQSYDGKADVYSLGVMLYQMLSGQVPFKANEGDPLVVSLLQMTQEPIPLREVNPEVPQAIADVVHKTLNKKPAQRPSVQEFMGEFIEALQSGADG